MTKTRLLQVLSAVGADEIVPGYNYNAISLRCRASSTKMLADAIRDYKGEIEENYAKVSSVEGWHLLDFVCVPLTRCVWVPVPTGTELNTISKVLPFTIFWVPFTAPTFG